MYVRLLKICILSLTMVFMVEVFSVSIGNYFKVIAKNVFGIQTGKKPYKDSGIENFGKVDENLLRGSQPDKEDYAKLKKAFGIKTILDLRDDAKSWAKEEAQKAGLRYINIPLSDKDYPTEEHVKAVEKAVMDESLYPIFLNCAGGVHRSGIAVAIYRILKYNYDINMAYKEMKAYNFYVEFGHKKIKDFIFDYAKNINNVEKKI